MEEDFIAESGPAKGTMISMDFIETACSEPKVSCQDCRYNDQDVDTFPCATCHTRN